MRIPAILCITTPPQQPKAMRKPESSNLQNLLTDAMRDTYYLVYWRLFVVGSIAFDVIHPRTVGCEKSRTRERDRLAATHAQIRLERRCPAIEGQCSSILRRWAWLCLPRGRSTWQRRTVMFLLCLMFCGLARDGPKRVIYTAHICRQAKKGRRM